MYTKCNRLSRATRRSRPGNSAARKGDCRGIRHARSAADGRSAALRDAAPCGLSGGRPPPPGGPRSGYRGHAARGAALRAPGQGGQDACGPPSRARGPAGPVRHPRGRQGHHPRAGLPHQSGQQPAPRRPGRGGRAGDAPPAPGRGARPRQVAHHGIRLGQSRAHAQSAQSGAYPGRLQQRLGRGRGRRFQSAGHRHPDHGLGGAPGRLLRRHGLQTVPRPRTDRRHHTV